MYRKLKDTQSLDCLSLFVKYFWWDTWRLYLPASIYLSMLISFFFPTIKRDHQHTHTHTKSNRSRVFSDKFTVSIKECTPIRCGGKVSCLILGWYFGVFLYFSYSSLPASNYGWRNIASDIFVASIREKEILSKWTFIPFGSTYLGKSISKTILVRKIRMYWKTQSVTERDQKK